MLRSLGEVIIVHHIACENKPKMKKYTLLLTVLVLFAVSSMANAQNNLHSLGEGDQPSLSSSVNGVIGITYGNDEDIFYVFSNDNGKTFSSPEKVATLKDLVIGMSSGPRLSMGKEYYSIIAPNRAGDLTAYRKKPDSKKWEGPFKVNDVPGSAGGMLADISSDDKGMLYATWIDTRKERESHQTEGHDMKPGGHEVKERAAREGHEKEVKEGLATGMNHSAAQPLSKEALDKEIGEMPEGAKGVSQYPGLDGKMYWVVKGENGEVLKAKDLENYKAFKAANAGRQKTQGKIYITTSTDGGKSWLKSKMVYASPDGSVCECCKPSILASNNNVYIMFRNNISGNRDLYLTRSNNGGNSFGSPEKLGMGTWPINGCPMDGGGLDVNTGTISTIWQRQGKVYTVSPGGKEVLLGSGRSPVIASTKNGNYALWNDGPKIMSMLPKDNKASEIGEGNSPRLLKLPNGQGALGVWISGDKIVAKRLM